MGRDYVMMWVIIGLLVVEFVTIGLACRNIEKAKLSAGKILISIKPEEIVKHLGKRAKIQFKEHKKIKEYYIKINIIYKDEGQYCLSYVSFGGYSHSIDFKDIISLEVEDK